MRYGPTIHPTRNKNIKYHNTVYERWALRTPVIKYGDHLEKVVLDYAKPYLQPGDILFISEKMVACTQGRAIPVEQIQACRLARFLCRFVRKTSYGIGLAMPQTMEMAIRECGRLRILFASFCGLIGKMFRRRGWFYVVAGEQAAVIDGPCEYTLPPYNHYVVLGPLHPNETARDLSHRCGVPVLIVDINDLGCKILGSSSPDLDPSFYVPLLKDNPLGQSDECTPIGILREADASIETLAIDQSLKAF